MPAWDPGAGPLIYNPPQAANPLQQSSLGFQQQQQLQQGQYNFQNQQNQANYARQLGLQQQQGLIGTQQQGAQLAEAQQLGQLQAQTAAAQTAEQLQQAQIAAQTSQQGFASQQNIAQIQAAASKYPAQLQQQRFQQVYPFLQKALTGQLPGFGGQGGALGGSATSGGQPRISANPVYSPQQIQQQVNDTRSTNDQGTQTQIAAMNENLAGRGFGANSPLAQALASGMQSANLAGNTSAETQLRLGAAGQNAQQVLAGQSAQENQYEARQREQIQRAQVYQSYLSSALAAISNFG